MLPEQFCKAAVLALNKMSIAMEIDLWIVQYSKG